MDKCSSSSSSSSCPERDYSEAVIAKEGKPAYKQITELPGQLQIDDENRVSNDNTNVIQCPGEGQDDEDDDDLSEEEDYLSEEDLLEQMGYGQCKHQMPYPEEEEEDEGTSDFSHKSNLVTTSMADLKLVSALKGSREKEGKSKKKCRVSWSPEVYDPSPTAEHYALNGPERPKSSQNVKTRKKGSAKGAGTSGGRGKAAGKDKKRGKKQGGRGGKNPDYS
ncbi:uncharacterized protein LOC127247435 [Andrographis paniculata]|uniref:uncharacterized protein LOC127247435 n=1 Tax=Andrographis paniculata TaxID=175694 RepID=UPI0021E9290B|nr:uncharacterized protein LOC127247435 [Andrographis paniculata]XP_051125221.1 uncharacterized protein LOC127247435 [Andrographis paniculata]